MHPICLVCTEPLSYATTSSQPSVIPCGHVSCNGCAQRVAQTTKRCPLRCSTDTIIRPRHIRDLAVSITEDDITTSTTFDNVVRHEKANLRADIQKFAMRTKSTESAHEELKLCVDRQVSAVNRHRNKQQAIVDDRKRLFLELTAAQSELDDRLELRRKLMATLLERCSQLEILRGAAVLSGISTVVEREDVFTRVPKRKFSTAEIEGSSSKASETADEAIRPTKRARHNFYH